MQLSFNKKISHKKCSSHNMQHQQCFHNIIKKIIILKKIHKLKSKQLNDNFSYLPNLLSIF